MKKQYVFSVPMVKTDHYMSCVNACEFNEFRGVWVVELENYPIAAEMAEFLRAHGIPENAICVASHLIEE